jgi:hypothetical protein
MDTKVKGFDELELDLNQKAIFRIEKTSGMGLFIFKESPQSSF